MRLQVLETEEDEDIDEVQRIEEVLIAARLIEPLKLQPDLPHISE